MNEADNPYAPGAGTRPPELAGRDEVLRKSDVAIARVQRGRSFKSFMFVGLRGVGKTVLLNEVRRKADAADCATILVEAHDGKSLPELLVPELRRVLISLDVMAKASDATRRGLQVLKSFIGSLKLKVGEIDVGVTLPPERGVADSGDLEADLPVMFIAVGEGR